MKVVAIVSLWMIANPLLFAAEAVAPVSGAGGDAGHQDGTGTSARFNDPMGLARDAQGNLFICDSRNHVIRKVPQGVTDACTATATGSGSISAGEVSGTLPDLDTGEHSALVFRATVD